MHTIYLYILYICSQIGVVEKAALHAHHRPGACRDTSVINARLSILGKEKPPLALSIILNMIMHKQGRKTLPKELRIDCQQLLREMEIQFENK